jgi:hypothetical protein
MFNNFGGSFQRPSVQMGARGGGGGGHGGGGGRGGFGGFGGISAGPGTFSGFSAFPTTSLIGPCPPGWVWSMTWNTCVLNPPGIGILV